MTGLFGLAVAILTWDYVQITPAPGLDGSWIVGLNLAASAGLDHGTEFVFTYGPLGFLEQPLVLDGLLATLGALWLLALRAALAATFLWLARRSLPWPAAALLALVAAMLIPPAVGSVPLALAAAWCLVALQDDAPAWASPLVVFGGGVLAGIEVMVKINVGATVLLLVAIAVLALPGNRVRNLITVGVVFLVTFAAGWFAAGQGIANITDYVSSSLQLLSGYGEAMQAEVGNVAWDGWAALAIAVATLGATVYASAGLPAIRRAAMLAIVAALLFSLEKYSFVRHDAGHVGAFFGTLAAVWLALRFRAQARFAPIAAVAVLALAYFPATGEKLDSAFQPKLAADQLSTLLDPGERERARDEAGAAMRGSYALDPQIVSRIGAEAVDIRPWEIGLAWAYGLNWRPLPVIQDYTAYTPELDRLNAEALAAADGPRFVLRHFGFDNNAATGIDGRFTSYDTPLATRELLCRFEPDLTSGSYQLLVRGDDRCGDARPLGTVTAAYGETIAVPAGRPGEAVFARVEGASAQGIERLRSLAFKAAIRRIELGSTASARLLTRNAADGLLISAPPELDFPDPFRLAPDVETIAIDSAGGFATSDGPLEIEFYAVPLDDGGA